MIFRKRKRARTLARFLIQNSRYIIMNQLIQQTGIQTFPKPVGIPENYRIKISVAFNPVFWSTFEVIWVYLKMNEILFLPPYSFYVAKLNLLRN